MYNIQLNNVHSIREYIVNYGTAQVQRRTPSHMQLSQNLTQL